MGAMVNNSSSKAKQLFFAHKQDCFFDEQWLRVYHLAGFCGQDSNVYLLKEKYLEEAIKFAKEQNITCEPSGIAGLGLFLQMKENIPKNKKIIIVNTGITDLK